LHFTRREMERKLEAVHTAAYHWAVMCCRGDEVEAEDVLQETYLRLLSGRARFEGRSELRTFVLGIVRRIAAERARKRERRRRLLRLARVDMPAVAPAPADTPDDVARLRVALTQLSRRQAQVLHLVFYEGLTIETASEVLEISLGTARTHYERGKSRLRTLLEAGVGAKRPNEVSA